MNESINRIIEDFKELKIVKGLEEKTGLEYLCLDFDHFRSEVSKDQAKVIDFFPKRMGVKSPHSVLEQFYRPDLRSKKLLKYLILEDKFFRSILLIISHSENIIISTDYLSRKKDTRCKTIKNILKRKLNKELEIIDKYFFDFWEINEEYSVLAGLVGLSLKGVISTTVFMPDIGTVIDIGSLATPIFCKNKDQWSVIERICATEGLYLEGYTNSDNLE